MADLQGYILDSNYGRVPTILEDQGDGTWAMREISRNMIWDTNTLTWIRQTAAAAGGGGPVSIADGQDVAEGTTSDAAWVSGAGTVISLLKKIAGGAASDVTDRVGRLLGHVNVDNFPATQAVSGSVSVSNFPADQLVHNTNIDVLLSTRLKPADTLTKVATVDTITNPVAVTGTFWQGTQPVSGTVAVSNPTANPETGLAKDATLTTNIGSVSAALTDVAVGTELDRLAILHKDDLIVIGLLRQAVAALTPPVKKVAAPASLLHGR